MIRTALSTLAFGLLLTLVVGCGERAAPRAAVNDPALDAKLERLLVVILESARSEGDRADSLSAEAGLIIEELGGRDSTAKVLAARLLDHSDRWLPLLDSLARESGASPPRVPTG